MAFDPSGMVPMWDQSDSGDSFSGNPRQIGWLKVDGNKRFQYDLDGNFVSGGIEGGNGWTAAMDENGNQIGEGRAPRHGSFFQDLVEAPGNFVTDIAKSPLPKVAAMMGAAYLGAQALGGAMGGAGAVGEGVGAGAVEAGGAGGGTGTFSLQGGTGTLGSASQASTVNAMANGGLGATVPTAATGATFGASSEAATNAALGGTTQAQGLTAGVGGWSTAKVASTLNSAAKIAKDPKGALLDTALDVIPGGKEIKDVLSIATSVKALTGDKSGSSNPGTQMAGNTTAGSDTDTGNVIDRMGRPANYDGAGFGRAVREGVKNRYGG